jgi:hypothetical protein
MPASCWYPVAIAGGLSGPKAWPSSFDAADYFAAVKSSIEKAQRTGPADRLGFRYAHPPRPDQRKTTSPDKLSKFLTWVVEQRPELEVYMLKWDLGVIDSLAAARPRWSSSTG